MSRGTLLIDWRRQGCSPAESRPYRMLLHGRQHIEVTSPVSKDVDQPVERVTDKEPSHASWLVGGTVLDRKPCVRHSFERGIDIVDFDREIGNRCTGAAL